MLMNGLLAISFCAGTGLIIWGFVSMANRDSNPQGARIRIDGRDLAPTPLMVRQLRPGTHTLELRLPGYKPWTQRLTVAAGDDRRITATLERDKTR
jgi:hypothetical protein